MFAYDALTTLATKTTPGRERKERVVTAKNELRAEVEIEADPDSVWAVSMDFEAYPDWNPFIHSIEGSQQVGAK
jgi:hypothetical protein